MDSLTHMVTGAVIARAIEDQKIGNWGTIAGLSVGIFPDFDYLLGLFNRQFFLQYHRDFTHSLLLIPFYALFFSWVFVKISKRDSFRSFYKICLLVLASHVLLDLLTSYGTMIFSPFFDHRYAWDFVFIIDLIFSGLVILPWLASLFWRRKSQSICRASLMGVALYILFCSFQHHRALGVARSFGQGLNEKVIQVASLPQPLSPFRWANYVETQDKIYQGFVDLLLQEPPGPADEQVKLPANPSSFFGKLRRAYQPAGKVHYFSYEKLSGSPWVERALNTEGVKFYYWFARFPVVRSVNFKDGRHRVEFMDVRFSAPTIRPPFVYYIEFDDSGRIASEGFLENRKIRDEGSGVRDP